MRAPACFTTSLALVLAGCASLNSTHRVQKVDGSSSSTASPTVISVDAKQRHLILSPDKESGKQTQWRVCAEASPDVFSAYASSLGLDLGFGATERQAKASSSIAEAAATIERTQTINLLRESMYRTCERYLSGALTEDQFIIQAARDQKSMVAVLAIEQLTGVFRRKATYISGPPTSASVVDGSTAAKLIEQFSAEEQTAKKALAAAEKSFQDADKKGKCSTVTERPADGGDPKPEDWDACQATKVLVAQRLAEVATAKERLDKTLALATDLVERTNASTSNGGHSIDQGEGSEADSKAITAVAEAVQKIVLSPGIEEPLMFCISYLQRKPDLIYQKVMELCSGIVQSRASEDEKERFRLLQSK